MVFLLALSAIPYAAFSSLGVNVPNTSSNQVQATTGPEAQNDGYFGAALAMSGNYVVAGASHNNASGIGGAGQVFITDAGTGAVLFTLISPNAQTNGRFGWDVAVSGDYVVVGAFKENVSGIVRAGHAYVYSASTGKLLSTLTSPNLQAYGYFGEAVAVSGNYVVVGAADENASGFRGAGHVYVFSASTGALLHTLTSPNAQHGGVFGYSVAVDGNAVVVGASYEAVAGLADAGNAYLFNANTGALISTLTIPNPQAGGYFGTSVAVTGDTVAVGAPWGNASGFAAAGNAYVFDANTGALTLSLASPNAQTNGDFGLSVAVGSDTVIVGAPYEASDGMPAAGTAYIFNANTGALISTLTSPNNQAGGVYGKVAASGNNVAVGAPGETASGHRGAGNAYKY